MGATPQSADTWADRVERWRASGLRAQDFAEREGCSAKSLAWWGSELKRRAEATKRPSRTAKADPEFLPVKVSTPRYVPFSTIEVELKSGHILRVEKGFDADTVRRLVEAIGYLAP
jgi:hypothetical protein